MQRYVAVLRQHAVAEERVDRAVLPLEAELELGLEVVELVEVAHAADCSFASRSDTSPRPGTTSSGASSASGSSTNSRSWSRGCGHGQARLVDRLARRRGAGRGRSSRGPQRGPSRTRPSSRSTSSSRSSSARGVELGLELGDGVQERAAGRRRPTARSRGSSRAARAPISSAARRIDCLAVAEVRAEPDVGDASPAAARP